MNSEFVRTDLPSTCLGLQVGGIVTFEAVTCDNESDGTLTQKDCAYETQQQLLTTDSPSLTIGRSVLTNPQLSNDN
jgi:hypothetical protein